MKPGTVINIRISSVNCMAIYDALQVAGINPSEITFSSGASKVLDMMMEALRRDKIIPTRDGFEYSTIMESFIPKDKKRLPSVAYAEPKIPSAGNPISYVTAEQRLSRVRFKELMIKKEHAPDTWTAEDDAELEQVYQQMG
jgi:hypothetical protein